MKSSNIALIAGLTLSLCSAAPLWAAEGATNAPAALAQGDVGFAKTAEKRAGDIMKALALTNSASAAKVKGIIVVHMVALHDWHEANNAKTKGATAEQAQQSKSALKAIHDKFISALSAELTPAQIESIKDKMTYNKVQVTYGVYCHNLPQMTDEQKAQVLDYLKQAREEAMDAGSGEDKSKVFRQYKGKINNYLSKQGLKADQADKEPQKKDAKTKAAKPEAAEQQ
jgi:hypothetical protein